MDEIGTIRIWVEPESGHRVVRIDHAKPRVRVPDWLATGNAYGLRYAGYVQLDGDVLTIRDDYGQRFIYRIRWDDHADGGYLAEWPD